MDIAPPAAHTAMENAAAAAPAPLVQILSTTPTAVLHQSRHRRPPEQNGSSRCRCLCLSVCHSERSERPFLPLARSAFNLLPMLLHPTRKRAKHTRRGMQLRAKHALHPKPPHIHLRRHKHPQQRSHKVNPLRRPNPRKHRRPHRPRRINTEPRHRRKEEHIVRNQHPHRIARIPRQPPPIRQSTTPPPSTAPP